MTAVYILLCVISFVLGALVYRIGVKDGLLRQRAEQAEVVAELEPLFPSDKHDRKTDKKTDNAEIELFEQAMNYKGAEPLRYKGEGE